jgi:L-rhamnose mutarotase
MAVHLGQEAEYERRHRPIWQELEDTLLEHGVRTYSIYLDPETSDLFGYVEFGTTSDGERWPIPTCAAAGGGTCGDHARQRGWQPVSRELREVFHIKR